MMMIGKLTVTSMISPLRKQQQQQQQSTVWVFSFSTAINHFNIKSVEKYYTTVSVIHKCIMIIVILPVKYI